MAANGALRIAPPIGPVVSRRHEPQPVAGRLRGRARHQGHLAAAVHPGRTQRPRQKTLEIIGQALDLEVEEVRQRMSYLPEAAPGFGAWLDSQMKAKGKVSRAWLTRETKISDGALRNYLSGQTLPDSDRPSAWPRCSRSGPSRSPWSSWPTRSPRRAARWRPRARVRPRAAMTPPRAAMTAPWPDRPWRCTRGRRAAATTRPSCSGCGGSCTRRPATRHPRLHRHLPGER